MSAAASLTISRAACHNHPQREAAAKCTSCGRHFCRECVTALDRRMLCAGCHRSKTEVKQKPRRDWFLVSVACQALLGFIALFFSAYFLGRTLLAIPSDFHEGTVWEKLGSE
jgi:hypothetical protein